jgi:glucan biosynthesis protein C
VQAVRASAEIADDHRPGLITLRAWAAVLVVLLHAAVPFAVTPMPGLAWPVRHPSPSVVVEAIFWGIACAIMPVFFWISGYGAAQSLAARGPREFWRGRWQRIGVPLLIFATVLLPCEFYIWLTGWALDGQIPWVKLRSLKLGPYHADLWGLSHLWYLEYLLLLCAALIAWDWFVERIHVSEAHGSHPVGLDRSRSRRPRTPAIGKAGLLALWQTPLRLIVTTLAAAAVLWWSPETLVGFQHSFFPVPAKLALVTVFFAGGVLTHRCGRIAISRGHGALVSAPLVLLTIFPLLRMEATGDTIGIDGVQLALGLGAYATLMTSGLWDFCAGQRREPGRMMRFVSSASYWTYLLHHPLVAACQIALRPTGWPALVQFALGATATLILCWTSYAWLVKPTAIGKLLNGRARPPRPEAESESIRRAA